MFVRMVTALMLMCGMTCAVSPAIAQDYPNHPIRLIVPFPPGAGNDLMGRITAQALTNILGQSVFVENRGGAGSQIGLDVIAKSKPDGYTLGWSASDGISMLPAVRPSVPYRVPESFSFIARITLLPAIVAVTPKLPIQSMAELVAYAKANPGKLRYGSAGIGGGSHLETELLDRTVGIQMLHVPYSGISGAVAALLSGDIDVLLAAPSSIKPLADAGTARVLATTGPERHPLFPNAPTLAESVPGHLAITLWYGVLGPPGIPQLILDRLESAIAQMLKDPVIVEKLAALGYKPEFLAGDAFKDFVVQDLSQWKQVAKEANIQLE
jgi:tripartite-type tricarboxylate transporter receptor subunit TctC